MEDQPGRKLSLTQSDDPPAIEESDDKLNIKKKLSAIVKKLVDDKMPEKQAKASKAKRNNAAPTTMNNVSNTSKRDETMTEKHVEPPKPKNDLTPPGDIETKQKT